jgi:hypothetical protein
MTKYVDEVARLSGLVRRLAIYDLQGDEFDALSTKEQQYRIDEQMVSILRGYCSQAERYLAGGA